MSQNMFDKFTMVHPSSTASHLAKVDVVIFAEGTYPFLIGGVSSVIHETIEGLPELSFGIIHLTWESKLPKNSHYPISHGLKWIRVITLEGLATAMESLRREIFPEAAVYHSHTTGYAGLAAVFAKQQHPGSRLLLSEHSLYVRDVLDALNGPASTAADGAIRPNSKVCANEVPPIAAGIDDLAALRERTLQIAELVYEESDGAVYLYGDMMRLAASYGLNPARATVIPNGVNPTKFNLTREFNAERDRKDARWCLAVLGRVVPIKGILEAIKCAHELHAKGFPFELRIIGPTGEDPHYAEECHRAVCQMRLTDHVHFLGPLPAEEALHGVDLLLVTSRSEAMPLVVLEAMASSVPVVSLDVGNISDVLRPAILAGVIGMSAGEVVPLGDMANSIVSLLQDTLRYNAACAAGPQIVETSFHIGKFQNSYRELYRSASSVDLTRAKLIGSARPPMTY